ncbi:anti-sigma factor [Streptomyces sp. NPDC015220]|uniref:anti-sigma factor n=1 Tax=Streptomyces sp. NPDC015220 TaxID=3364947 RepID=UPI0036FB2765
MRSAATGRLPADREREIAHVLAAPGARTGAGRCVRCRGVAVIASVTGGRAVITLSGHPAAPGGRFRRPWGARPGPRPPSSGLFAGGTPPVAPRLATPGASLAVTVEPDGGSARPAGPPTVQLASESAGLGE